MSPLLFFTGSVWFEVIYCMTVMENSDEMRLDKHSESDFFYFYICSTLRIIRIPLGSKCCTCFTQIEVYR